MEKKQVEWGYYTAVRFGRFDREAQAYVYQYDDTHYSVVCAKKVARVVQRLKDGYDHVTACPVHGMTRQEAGYLLANAERILKEINS